METVPIQKVVPKTQINGLVMGFELISHGRAQEQEPSSLLRAEWEEGIVVVTENSGNDSIRTEHFSQCLDGTRLITNLHFRSSPIPCYVLKDGDIKTPYDLTKFACDFMTYS